MLGQVDGHGHPDLKMRRDVLGTSSGVAKSVHPRRPPEVERAVLGTVARALPASYASEMIGRGLGNGVGDRAVPSAAADDAPMKRAAAARTLARAYRARLHLP